MGSSDEHPDLANYEHRGRAKICLGRGYKWEDVQGVGARCRCDHAASFSGRFQSSARAASLCKAVSETHTLSESIVTNARRGSGSWTGSSKRTFPCSSIVASIVCNIIASSLCLKPLEHIRYSDHEESVIRDPVYLSLTPCSNDLTSSLHDPECPREGWDDADGGERTDD